MPSNLSPQDQNSAAESASVERIRDVALGLFAVHGTEATSLRMIADAAGVSIGLLQHYFGTKANLVSAIDNYVMDLFGEAVSPALMTAANPIGDVAHRISSLVAGHVEVVDYLCRALVDATPTGVRIFDGLLEIGRGGWERLAGQGMIRPDADPAWVALHPLVLVLGTFMLRSHLERHLPDAFATPAQLDRWQKATQEFISKGQLRGRRQQQPKRS